MNPADLLTLFTRVFAAGTLLVISVMWARRGDWLPTVLFFTASSVVWVLAVRLFRTMREEYRRQSQTPEEKP